MSSEISDPLRIAQGALHPWMMGGEYLPSLIENEVEICRVVLKSTTMDVFSMRAQKQGELIKYRVVDEYGEVDYLLPINESKIPLSMKDLIENLDLCKETLKDTGEEHSLWWRWFGSVMGVSTISIWRQRTTGVKLCY